MLPPPTIVWFRNDLRLSDNTALAEAIDIGAPVLPVYIDDSEAYGAWKPGEASNWWLHHALQSLGRSLESLGGKLVLRQGDSLQVLKDVVAESGAKRLYWNRRYEGSQRELDAESSVTFWMLG